MVRWVSGVTVSTEVLMKTVEEFVDELARQETVTSVGLFGSWARYEASEASDLDFLVVDRSGIDFEFYELVERGGLLFDMNRIPWSWVGEVVRPEIDHRLHEAVVLYDRGGLLERARGFVEGNYRTPGRVEVRTEGYLATSETYLSRASSAMTRRDPETAAVYTDVSLYEASSILMDVAGFPITRGSFVWNMRRACEKLREEEVYRAVMSGTRLSEVVRPDVDQGLGGFEAVWRQVSGYIGYNRHVVEGMHEVLKRDIAYMTDPAMLRLILSRAGGMLEGNDFVEALVYLRGWLLRLLEDYAWVMSAKRGDKFDYTSLFRTIGEDEKAKDVFDDVFEIFNLGGVDEGVARRALGEARSVISRVRRDRRRLIEEHLG
ncbi:MAG: nucleotidyltransferase family protein [Candidatus Bathyarchaeia archaeon]